MKVFGGRRGGSEQEPARFWCALLLLAVPLSLSCGSTRHEPARSPRIAIVSNAVVKDGKKYPSYFGGGVVDAVRGNPRAEAEARSGRDLVVSGFVMSLAGLTAEATGLVMSAAAATQADEATGTTSSNTTGDVGAALALGGVVIAVSGLVLMFNGQPRLVDAVNIYNDGLAASGADGLGAPGGTAIQSVPQARPAVEQCTEVVKRPRVRQRPRRTRAK